MNTPKSPLLEIDTEAQYCGLATILANPQIVSAIRECCHRSGHPVDYGLPSRTIALIADSAYQAIDDLSQVTNLAGRIISDWLPHQGATDKPHDWANPVLITLMMLTGELVPLLQDIEGSARHIMKKGGAE